MQNEPLLLPFARLALRERLPLARELHIKKEELRIRSRIGVHERLHVRNSTTGSDVVVQLVGA